MVTQAMMGEFAEIAHFVIVQQKLANNPKLTVRPSQ